MITLSIEDLEDGVHEIESETPAETLDIPTDEGRFASPVKIKATITKMGTDLVLRADIAVLFNVPCSRCLANFTEDVESHIDILYERSERLSINEEDVDEADDLVFLDLNAREVEIGPRVVESICLALPFKPLCKDDCLGLCPACGTDLNSGTCNCTTEVEDPRWQALKSINQTN